MTKFKFIGALTSVYTSTIWAAYIHTLSCLKSELKMMMTATYSEDRADPPVIHSTCALERSPFDPNNHAAYAQWRTWKCDQFVAYKDCGPVVIKNPGSLTLTERTALLRHIRATNMVVYECQNADSFSKQDLRSLAMQLGLNRLDGHRLADNDRIASLQVSADPVRQRYIPYTAKAINWHTDGYYNPPEKTIRAFMMHCNRPAKSGGENMLLDPDMVYIHMRDQSPELLDALFDSNVMNIPPNRENGETIRAQQSGSVFSIDTTSGSLHMRYTARLTNIEWNNSAKSQEALSSLNQAIDQCQQYTLRHKLNSGQGIICNNVLHGRTAFDDGSTTESTRLLYRARFYDRVIGTETTDCPYLIKQD